MRKLFCSNFLLFCYLITGIVLVTPNAFAYPKRPKLIVLIVIDQFRADYLTRFEKRFLPARMKNGDVGGLNYLTSSGAYFPFAQYDILQSMTGPGHATVLTGAYPYLAGIPNNYWYNKETNELVYCTEDASQPTVGIKTDKLHLGTSPRNLLATTLGDELKNAGYPSRVVSVAHKDRAAILMGGHRADFALWFDTPSRQWVSSQYYLSGGKLPDWVNQLNTEVKTMEGKTVSWEAAGPGTGLSEKSNFPHKVEFSSRKAGATPTGLELTEAAAERAFDAFKLGTGKATDLFTVSFSSHDYAGHEHGPNSREMEEMTVHDDRLISKLLNHIRKKVPGGLGEVVVALTGDHGVGPDPDWLKANRINAARVDEEALQKTINHHLTEKYGKLDSGTWVLAMKDFGIYLNRRGASEKQLDMAKIEKEVKDIAMQNPGFAFGFTASEYSERKLPPGMHERQILHTYFPGRGGDVTLIPKPFYIPAAPGSADHLTGYSYDRTVPLVLSGLHVKRGLYATRAEMVDLAPTLSFLAGVIPPSMSEGRVLSEAILPIVP